MDGIRPWKPEAASFSSAAAPLRTYRRAHAVQRVLLFLRPLANHRISMSTDGSLPILVMLFPPATTIIEFEAPQLQFKHTYTYRLTECVRRVLRTHECQAGGVHCRDFAVILMRTSSPLAISSEESPFASRSSVTMGSPRLQQNHVNSGHQNAKAVASVGAVCRTPKEREGA